MRTQSNPKSNFRLQFVMGLALILFPFISQAETPALKRIVFLGDSLTAGYGLSPNEAYPQLIGKKIESAQLPFEIVPAGLSGDTSAGGARRIKWLLRKPVDILVLALGANDGLRGFPPEETEKNLQSIIDSVKARNPDAKIVVAGMEMPPNVGPEYQAQFRNIFLKIAKDNQATLIPFLLKDVAGKRNFNLKDGIHPNALGHRIIAKTVWAHLEGVLNEK